MKRTLVHLLKQVNPLKNKTDKTNTDGTNQNRFEPSNTKSDKPREYSWSYDINRQNVSKC
jgi:hypothetical protein